MFLCWPTYRSKQKRNGQRIEASSIQKIGSENIIEPHVLSLPVPSALSNSDTICPTVIFEEIKKRKESKCHFLRKPQKYNQCRNVQKIKNVKESRCGSISSNEDLQRTIMKTSWISSEHKKSRSRSYSSSSMISTPIQDLQIFGSVPPTPTPSERSQFKLSSNGSGFRNKSATLPNTGGSNFVSIFDRMAKEKYRQPIGKADWDTNKDTTNDCPCSSCKEKRWQDIAGNHYQFPARSPFDRSSMDTRIQQSVFYYNSNPVSEYEINSGTQRKANGTKYKSTGAETFVYANLLAIQDANGEIKKSKATSENWWWNKKGKNTLDDDEFRSLPKNFIKPFHSGKGQKAISESSGNLSTNVLCPCCGNVFHYSLPNEISKYRRVTMSEPATPTNFTRDHDIFRDGKLRDRDIFKNSKLFSSIPLPDSESDNTQGYLKPNKTKDNELDTNDIPSIKKDLQSEVQLLYLVPPPQCHSPEASFKFHAYENGGESWKSNSGQSNSSENQMNYVAHIRNDEEINKSENSKNNICNPDKDSSQISVEISSKEVSDNREEPISGVDVSKYEIKIGQTRPNIYLRPKPVDPCPNFPYVWLLSNGEETDETAKCAKFVNSSKKSFSRLPPLKENVAFYT